MSASDFKRFTQRANMQMSKTENDPTLSTPHSEKTVEDLDDEKNGLDLNDSFCDHSPLVHTLETSGVGSMPDTFRDHLRNRHQLELDAVQESYRAIDNDIGSNYFDKQLACRSRAYFHRHKETGDIKVISNCCRLRWCPFCAEGRKFRIQETVKDWLPDMQRPKFLTLTLKHTTAPLSHQIKHLYESFQKFRKLKFVRDNTSGGVWFFQIKISESDGLWHPHLHCLIDAVYMSRKYLAQLWEDVTGNSMVIDIRGVVDGQRVADYVARYAAKPGMLSDMSVEESVEMVQALHGRRLVGTWGSARHLSFRTVKQEDANSWQRIADFQIVTARYRSDKNARLIFNAWKKNEPLAELVYLTGATSPPDDHFIKKRVRSVDCYGQSFLFKFK